MALTNPMTKGVYLGLKPMIVNGSQVGVVPNVGGSVTFYAAGTTNPQTVYTDPGLTVPFPSPGNVVNLNSSGFAVIYLANLAYKYVESDSSNNPIFTQDNYPGGNSGSGFGGIFVDNIASLKLLNTNTYSYAYIAGYYTNGDGGSGLFYNATSSDPDDGGYTIKSTFDATKDWFRIPDENGEVRAASFGYIPQNIGDQTVQLQAADVYANSIGATLSVQSGITNPVTVSTASFSSNFRLEEGAEFKGDSAATLTFAGVISAPTTTIFGTNITAVLSAKQIAIPEWFGANTSLPDNMAAFTALFASGAGGFKINPGTWVCSALTPPTTPRILSFGLVWDGTNTFIPIGEYNLNVGFALTVTGPIESLGGTGGVTTSGQFYGASLQLTGNAQVAGTIVSGSTITSENNIIAISNIFGNGVTSGVAISAATTITAGTGGVVGYVSALAGSGTGRFRASGRLGYVVATSGNVTIPANTLLNNGDALRIVVSATTAITEIQLKYGSTAISAISLTAATPFIMTVDMIRTGTSTAFCYGAAAGSTGASASLNAIAGLDFTASHDISATVTGGSQESIVVDFFPISP